MMVCVLWSLGLKRNHLFIHQKFFTGPNPNKPLPSKLLSPIIRYSWFLSGSVKRESVRWRFLRIYMFILYTWMQCSKWLQVVMMFSPVDLDQGVP